MLGRDGAADAIGRGRVQGVAMVHILFALAMALCTGFMGVLGAKADAWVVSIVGFVASAFCFGCMFSMIWMEYKDRRWHRQ